MDLRTARGEEDARWIPCASVPANSEPRLSPSPTRPTDPDASSAMAFGQRVHPFPEVLLHGVELLLEFGGTDVDLARDGLLNDGLLLLLQQLDQFPLDADVALDATIRVVEVTGNGGLFGEERDW